MVIFKILITHNEMRGNLCRLNEFFHDYVGIGIVIERINDVIDKI